MSSTYLLRRLFAVVLVLWIVTIAIFAITTILPGNAAIMILGEYATPDQVTALEERLGLNRPAAVQYFEWLFNLLQGDFGMSLRLSVPVSAVVGSAFANSALLAVTALSVVTIVSIPLGVLAALKRGTKADLGISFVAYIGTAMPEFVTATLLLVIFAGPNISLLPAGGFIPQARA